MKVGPEVADVVRRIASDLGVMASDDQLAPLDSLRMVELVVGLEEALDLSPFPIEFHYKDFRSVETVLELIARARGATSATEHAVPLAPTTRADAPLSFAQEGLWFLHQLDPDSRAYNLPFAYRMSGDLDLEVLRRAFEELLRRHEALRTVFLASDGIPCQHVQPPSRFELPVENLSALSPEQRERELARVAEQVALARFDLATGPMIVARVVRLSKTEHVVLVNIHHIVSDGWSLDVVWRDLAALYATLLRGAPPDLRPLDVQYADYVAWSRQTLSGPHLDRELAYWKQRLDHATDDLALPYKGSRPRVPTFRGGRVDIALDPTVTTALRALAHQHDATMFMVVLAALRALLARYTGQVDLCIGTAIANRSRPELKHLVGFFVNTLILRGEVRLTDRFVDLIARERDTALSAYNHQHAPFDLVIDSLGLPRRSDRPPLLQVMCVDRGAILVDEIAWPGVTTEPFEISTELASFELSVEVRERGGMLELSFGYSADLFDHTTIEELAARYRRLLVGIAAHPESPLSQIDLAGGDPRAAVATHETWRARGPGVIELIERWMAETPAAPAIVSLDGTTSYGELETQSARLATLLRRRGVGPDRPVVVVAECGVPQIVGILGALRAGGAYVPIKPDLPDERIRWMLDDTAPVAILCDGPPPAALAPYAATVIRLDEPAAWPARDAFVPVPVPDSALAYMIYTSGSTGRPKGVMVSRRNFDAQMHWIQHEFPLGAADRCLQLFSFTFDASVSDIFWPLMVGGAIVQPRAGLSLEPRHLDQLVRETHATVVHVAPSMMWVLLDTIDATRWQSVRWLMVGGEALSLELARECARQLPDAELVNLYGPTETTITVTFYRFRDDGKGITIGGPVADTSLHVLDAHLAPVPNGVVGELWVGGVQVARGYMRRPALTAERFIPNPFSTDPGERLYRTGDLVRRREDGTLEYLGRSDTQVKVRGFRIELGEIEAALHQHPAIKTAAVLPRRAGAHDAILVAYVCTSAPAADDELRRFVAARLPEYMVPSAFVVLDELPLTTSGKLDHDALPAPDQDRANDVAPRTPTESALARIWCELLGADHSTRVSFFAVGGNSLLVIRLVVRISRELGVELLPREVFDRPTIAEQAELIDARASDDAAIDPAEQVLVDQIAAMSDLQVAEQLAEWSLVELEPVTPPNELVGPRRELLARLLAQHRIDARPSLPLARRASATAPATFATQLQWDFHTRGEFRRLSIHTTAVALHGPLDTGAMQRAITALVERQPALRTVFAVDRDQLVLTVRDRGPELELVDLSGDPPARREARARALFEASGAPHDLRREVFRAQLVRLDEREHLLFLVPHHIVVDGFSWSVLLTDLAALYRGIAGGKEPELAPLVFHNTDFCFWQVTLEQRPLGKAQLEFWGRALAGYQALELTADRHASSRGSVGLAVDTYEAGEVPFAIEGTTWSAVERLCAQVACTPFTVVATGFLLLLARWAGRDDVCIMSSNFHRNREGSELVVGNFVTPYPLRVAFDGQITLEDAVRRCHETILRNREHGHASPASALGAWPEWSRYNLNYLIEPREDELDFTTARAERLDWNVHANRTGHDVALFLRQANGVRGNFVYNAERFSPELAGRAATRLGELIEAMATSRTLRVADLDGLGEPR